MPECLACGGSALIFMGRLGNLRWFYCRDCGWEQHDSPNDGDIPEIPACPSCGRETSTWTPCTSCYEDLNDD